MRVCAAVREPVHLLFRSTDADGEMSHGVRGDEMQPNVEHGRSFSQFDTPRCLLCRGWTPCEEGTLVFKYIMYSNITKLRCFPRIFLWVLTSSTSSFSSLLSSLPRIVHRWMLVAFLHYALCLWLSVNQEGFPHWRPSQTSKAGVKVDNKTIGQQVCTSWLSKLLRPLGQIYKHRFLL